MKDRLIAKVLTSIKTELEEVGVDSQEIVLAAFKKTIVKCRIVGITNSNLKDASYGKKYMDAITILKEKGLLTEIQYGRTKVLYLTELIDDIVKKYSPNATLSETFK